MFPILPHQPASTGQFPAHLPVRGVHLEATGGLDAAGLLQAAQAGAAAAHADLLAAMAGGPVLPPTLHAHAESVDRIVSQTAARLKTLRSAHTAERMRAADDAVAFLNQGMLTAVQRSSLVTAIAGNSDGLMLDATTAQHLSTHACHLLDKQTDVGVLRHCDMLSVMLRAHAFGSVDAGHGARLYVESAEAVLRDDALPHRLRLKLHVPLVQYLSTSRMNLDAVTKARIVARTVRFMASTRHRYDEITVMASRLLRQHRYGTIVLDTHQYDVVLKLAMTGADSPSLAPVDAAHVRRELAAIPPHEPAPLRSTSPMSQEARHLATQERFANIAAIQQTLAENEAGAVMSDGMLGEFVDTAIAMTYDELLADEQVAAALTQVIFLAEAGKIAIGPRAARALTLRIRQFAAGAASNPEPRLRPFIAALHAQPVPLLPELRAAPRMETDAAAFSMN